MPAPPGRRSRPSFPCFSHALAALATLAALTVAHAALAATPRVHAITNARIVTAPGQVIPRGTLVIRDGVITAVGANVAVPADARVWPGDSLTVYAGMIDAFVVPSEAGVTRPGTGGPGAAPAASAPVRGAASSNAAVTPEVRMVEALPLGNDQLENLRGAGFAVVQLAPRSGIVRGQSAVVGLGDGSANENVVRADFAQVMAPDPQARSYPGSLMGAIAVLRQTFLDAKWYRDAVKAYAKAKGTERPDENVSLQALQPVIAGTQPVVFVADEMLEVLRCAQIAKEAAVTARIVGAGDEYKRAEDIVAVAVPLIVPVNFPDAPDVSNGDNVIEVSTEELRHWQQAPGNPAALEKVGARFALTSNGLKDVKSFRANVAKAIARGYKADAALAAVTIVPAELLGLSDKLGTIAPGKIANLTVTRGDLFGEKSTVREVWVDGRRYEVAKGEGMKGHWTLGGGAGTLLVAADKDTTVKLVNGADTLKATGVNFQGDRVRFTVSRGGSPEHYALTANQDKATGTVSGAGGPREVSAWRAAEPAKDAKPADAAPVATPIVMGNTEAWRAPRPAQPAAVIVKNATIWTAGPQGTLENADIVLRGGKVAAVGRNLATPSGAVVIDGAGKHVAPGIIDEHSHSAILGNVNECTNNVTCEVRIQDVINSESTNIYRQLAGGTTIMHLLHGSCNAIGGQAAVIKNKWGEAPDQLLYALAPPTVKFALGENPKQSNWGNERTSRYPKSRAGVEESIREAFTGALDYKASFAKKGGIPPRRDLQEEALLEILEGKRFIHCHSYRADEILALMRLTEDFGFRVNTFTHVLEGYKVANEIEAHGASALGFTDWWAYKQEVIDAIPYNAYILWSRGVNTGFNSDSDELARRLNTEATKAIKYGGVPPQEAIKFVTLNPAKSLKIDKYVGSLEVGKDADFSVWDGSPLSPFAHCEQTWIEGRKYFDRAADLEGRAALAQERTALIARAKAAKKDAGGGGKSTWPPRYLDDTDMSGNACLEDELYQPFLSETARKQMQNGEVQR